MVMSFEQGWEECCSALDLPGVLFETRNLKKTGLGILGKLPLRRGSFRAVWEVDEILKEGQARRALYI